MTPMPLQHVAHHDEGAIIALDPHHEAFRIDPDVGRAGPRGAGFQRQSDDGRRHVGRQALERAVATITLRLPSRSHRQSATVSAHTGGAA